MDPIKVTVGKTVYYKINSSTRPEIKAAMLGRGYEINDPFLIISPTLNAEVLTFPINKTSVVVVYLQDKQGCVLCISTSPNAYDNTFSRSLSGSKESPGIEYEADITSELNNWAHNDPITNPMAIAIATKIEALGGKAGGEFFQRGHSEKTSRPIRFDDNGIFVHSRNVSDHGHIVSDITYVYGSTHYYISLKSASSCKAYNGGITKVMSDPKLRYRFVTSLGFDAMAIEEHFGLPPYDGIRYHADHLLEFVRTAIGAGYIYAQRLDDGSIKVEYLDGSEIVTVSSTSQVRYNEKSCVYNLDITVGKMKFSNSKIRLVNQTGKGIRTPNIVYIDIKP